MDIKKQNGIAIVFSLVILLVMTLLGVSVVQQNKMQFLMAANTREQTQALSNAENILALAELNVKVQRQNTEDPSSFCFDNAGGEFTPLFTNANNSPVTINLGLANTVATIENCQHLGNGSLTTTTCENTQAAGSELYTIRVRYTDDAGAIRTVESLYAVNCSQRL